MLTKYILQIGEKSYNLHSDSIRNWDQIKCAYSRKDLGGVVRSFTSQFEFVGEAYDALKALFLRDQFNAHATICVLTIDNNWRYNKQFEAPLDFSTIKWDNYVLSINSVDSGVAATIKAKKSTKFDFAIGTDIESEGTFHFERIPMTETVTYQFTRGGNQENSADILTTVRGNNNPFMGVVEEEIYVNKTIHYVTDQDEDSKYMLECGKPTTLDFDYLAGFRRDKTWGKVTLFICQFRNDELLKKINIGTIYGDSGASRGEYATEADLKLYNKNPEAHHWATVKDIVYITAETTVPDTSGELIVDPIKPVNPGDGNIDPRDNNSSLPGTTTDIIIGGSSGSSDNKKYVWVRTGKTTEEYWGASIKGHRSFEMQEGDTILITQHIDSVNNENEEDNAASLYITDQYFKFSWRAIGDPVDMQYLTPLAVLNGLMSKMEIECVCKISNHDERLKNTILLPGEAIRKLEDAKLTTSFNNFCEWMSAVFGYVYTIEFSDVDKIATQYPFGGFDSEAHEITDYDEEVSYIVKPDEILYNTALSKFVVKVGDEYFSRWHGSENYNDPETSSPIIGNIFNYGGESYRVEESNGNIGLRHIIPTTETVTMPVITFKHRSEIFTDGEPTIIKNVRDVSYSVDNSYIYSSLKIGYEKQEYDSINGRDEFNFHNEYTTGCTYTEKTLSLMSPYRADCYGIEFTAQKINKDTTDSSSDSSVFFVLTKPSTTKTRLADRSVKIENALSDMVFNGKFAPMYCVEANAGFIGMQDTNLHLTFASTTGNEDVIVDSLPMKGDINLNAPLATCGIIEFSSDFVDFNAHELGLIQLKSHGSIYNGYLLDVNLKYAKAETATFKLIVKNILPC